jgi:branched-chain amino acid transport system permease protein
VFLVRVRYFTTAALGGGGSGLTYILYGGIIMLIARFEPGGLLDVARRIAQRRRYATPSAAVAGIGDRAA